MEKVEDTILPPIEDSPQANVARADGPVPLSFPAILRNAALTSRFAHLTLDPEQRKPAYQSAVSKKSIRRNDNEGKRWVRRKENGTTRTSFPKI